MNDLLILASAGACTATMIGGVFALKLKSLLPIAMGFSAGAVIGVAFLTLGRKLSRPGGQSTTRAPCLRSPQLAFLPMRISTGSWRDTTAMIRRRKRAECLVLQAFQRTAFWMVLHLEWRFKPTEKSGWLWQPLCCRTIFPMASTQSR